MFPSKASETPILVAGGVLIALLVGKGRYEDKLVTEAISITKDLLREARKEWPSNS